MGLERPKLAVWKFASCDGCQLTVLDCLESKDALLEIADQVEIAYFMEASSAVVEGPYDLSLVEGSVTTPQDAERIKRIRQQSDYVVALGACATAGGIQALRNMRGVREFASIVYARPEYIDTLDRSLPMSAFVHVDYELQGCPISKSQLLDVLSSFLNKKKPNPSAQSVCMECKIRGNVCVLVAHGTPCMGPVTHDGCKALCPAYLRGCYSCYGPKENPNVRSLGSWFRSLGVSGEDLERMYHTFYCASPEFREVRDPGLGPFRKGDGDDERD